jgi:glycosyltransferase involved in cell wall biosynthesis
LDNPLVSIIVPFYNAEKFIKGCLDSIFFQTFQNFECILIDDGSTDKSLDICNFYAKKDNRFRIIQQENSGVSAARNKGITTASGEYIMFADSDDYLLPDMMQKLYDAIESRKSDVVCCGYEHKGKTYSIPDAVYIASQAETVYWFEKYELFGLIWNKLYTVKIIKDNGIQFPLDRFFGEDMYFNLQYFSKIKSASVIHNPLYVYCENPTSITKKRPSFDQCLFRFKNISRTIVSLQEKNGCNFIPYILAMDFTYTVFLIRSLYIPYRSVYKSRFDLLSEIKYFYNQNSAKKTFRSSKYLLFYCCLLNTPVWILDKIFLFMFSIVYIIRGYS